MSDFGTAMAAVRQHFETGWADQTPVFEQNKPARAPIDGNGRPVPWVFLELVGISGARRGVGLPGAQTYEDLGRLTVTVFVPEGSARDRADALAIAAGKIFRDAPTFTDGGGALVQCDAPTPPNPDSAATSPFGNQYGVSTSIPFRFFY